MKDKNGFTPLVRSAEHGFTLVEMMVALFIFGILAAAGTMLLSFSVRAQAGALARLDATARDTQMAALLAADLGQATPRLSRDTAGATIRAFTGTNGVGAAPVMRYVRGGWTNSDGTPRAALQRVDLVLVGDRLERRSFPMVDGAVPRGATVLADGVQSVKLRYRDRGGWRDAWDDPRSTALPKAVELTLRRNGQPPLLMAFLVGTGT